MPKVVLRINIIKSSAINHRQFKEFLDDLGAEYEDLVYYCEMRWFRTGKMLKRFSDLSIEVYTFIEMN